MAIGARDVTSIALGAVKRRVRQLDQADRIAGIIGKTGYTDTHRQLKPGRGGMCLSTPREHGLLNTASHPLCRDQPLQVVGIEQERRKLFAAETRRYVTRPQSSLDNRSDLLQRLVADQVSVVVVYGFEMIEIHHQHAKRLRELFRPRRLAAEFAKERLAC